MSPGGACRPTRRATGDASATERSHTMPVHIDWSLGPSVGRVATARALGLLLGAVPGSISARISQDGDIPLPGMKLRAWQSGCPVTERASSVAGQASSEAEQASSVAGQASSEAEQASSVAGQASSEAEQASFEAEQASSEAEQASSEAGKASSATEHRPLATACHPSAVRTRPNTPRRGGAALTRIPRPGLRDRGANPLTPVTRSTAWHAFRNARPTLPRSRSA